MQLFQFARWRYSVFALSLSGAAVSAVVGVLFGRYDTNLEYQAAARLLSSQATWRYVRTATDHGRPATEMYAYRPPGFPAVLAAAYKVLGANDAAVILLQSLLVALIIAAISLIGRKIFGPTVGFLSGMLTLFFPYLLFHFQSVIDTTLYTACLLWMLYGALLMGSSSDYGPAALTGLSACSAVLTRPTAVVLVLCAAIWLVYVKTPFRLLAIFAACFLTPLSAWLIHLNNHLGAFSFVSTNGGWNLWLSNNGSTFSYLKNGTNLDNIEWDEGQSFDYLSGMSESEEQSAFRQAARTWVSTHPMEFLKLTAYKTYLTALPILRPNESNAKAALLLVSALPVYLGGLVATVRWLRKPEVTLISAIIALSMALNVVFLPYTRILAPVYPLMICLTVALIVDLLKRCNKQ